MIRDALRAMPGTRGLRGRVRRLRLEFWRWLDVVAERAMGLHHLDTEGIIMLDDLGVAAPDRVQYQPSRYLALIRAMRGTRVTRDDVFLDYGCGKGRVLAQAAKCYPFGRVIGVDVSEELAETARANLSRIQPHLKAGDAQVVVADAERWPLPDDVTYIFMYRPFTGKVFGTVMQRIIESLERRPRRLVLIYTYPEQESVILETGRFVRTRTFRSPARTAHRRVSVYVSEPPSVQEPGTKRPEPGGPVTGGGERGADL